MKKCRMQPFVQIVILCLLGVVLSYAFLFVFGVDGAKRPIPFNYVSVGIFAAGLAAAVLESKVFREDER